MSLVLTEEQYGKRRHWVANTFPQKVADLHVIEKDLQRSTLPSNTGLFTKEELLALAALEAATRDLRLQLACVLSEMTNKTVTFHLD